ncbi:MAG: helix-turn-helix transcriptional regulator [Pseudomonadales bacterium]|nr:helix-turn-helix transcriptional regulator [Pseudomonadales bacterium]
MVKTAGIPLPGQPVRGSKTGKPIMALLDQMGRTWSLGILWQLNMQSLTFRQLQTSCEQISPTLLNTRLKELRQLQLVEHGNEGYCLTVMGQQLFEIILPLGQWSDQWAAAMGVEQRNDD